MQGSAKRAYPRYAIDAEIELRMATRIATGRTRNISRGGLCLLLDEAVPPGTGAELRIKLTFDDDGESEPLVLHSRIMWSTPLDDVFQVGCQFDGLRPRDLAFLEMFLRYLEDKHEPGAVSAAKDDPFA